MGQTREISGIQYCPPTYLHQKPTPLAQVVYKENLCKKHPKRLTAGYLVI